jgi:hypothetical protein
VKLRTPSRIGRCLEALRSGQRGGQDGQISCDTDCGPHPQPQPPSAPPVSISCASAITRSTIPYHCAAVLTHVGTPSTHSKPALLQLELLLLPVQLLVLLFNRVSLQLYFQQCHALPHAGVWLCILYYRPPTVGPNARDRTWQTHAKAIAATIQMRQGE